MQGQDWHKPHKISKRADQFQQTESLNLQIKDYNHN